MKADRRRASFSAMHLALMLRTAPRAFVHANAWLMPLAFVAVMVYLAYHAFASDRGLFALSRLQAERDRVAEQLAIVKGEREHMERRVAHMSPESLDLDLVDEQSRRVLGMSDPDEMVVMLPRRKPAEAPRR